ncbi:MAG TPA: Ig-like domain-containing protein [Polyangia bacterium]|jgi:uncharacterized protein YjdB
MRHNKLSSVVRIVVLLAGTAGLTACSGTPAVETAPAPPVGATAGPMLVRIDVRIDGAVMLDGASQGLAATGTFDDGSSADLTDLVTWSSLDATVATIDAGKAKLIATGPGTTTITATLGNISGSGTVTITAALRSIVVSPGLTRIAPCGSRQLAAVASFSDGTQRDVTALADWSTSDGAVATVAGSDGTPGLVTASSAGAVTISAKWGGAAGSLTLTADPTVPKMIAVSPTNLTVRAGDSIGFTTTATYCDESTQDVTMASTWISSSPEVATITDVEAGMHVANATRAGTTFISAQLDGLSDAIELQVMPPTLRSIFIDMPGGDDSNTTVVVGSSTALTATAEYNDGSTQDVTAAVTWSSSDPATATVSSAGVVTAIAPGEVTITLAMDGHYGSFALTVTQ